MLLDPCNAEVVPGIYGTSDGLTAKFRNYTFNSSGANSGYILWVPQLCNEGIEPGVTTNGTFNVFCFAAGNPLNSPINTIAAPLGSSDYWSVNTCGAGLPDPCAAFGAGDTCQVQRMISACIKMTYTGAMVNASGQVGYITDVDPFTLIGGGNSSGPPSVSQMFNLCSKTERIGVRTHENRYSAATDNDSVYHGTTNACWEYSEAEATAIRTRVGATASRFRYPAFGFAWRGLDIPSGGDTGLSFELTKNIEWRPEPVSGLVQPNPVHHGPEKRTGILTALDRMYPNWATASLDAAAQYGPALAESIFTGTAGPMLRTLRGRAV